VVKLDLIVRNYRAALRADLTVSADYLEHDVPRDRTAHPSVTLGLCERFCREVHRADVPVNGTAKFFGTELTDPLPLLGLQTEYLLDSLKDFSFSS
jgi:hypothetical protein